MLEWCAEFGCYALNGKHVESYTHIVKRKEVVKLYSQPTPRLYKGKQTHSFTYAGDPIKDILAHLKDGAGVMPYGYAARTDKANLIGRMEVDLKKEMMQLQIDSRSREGVGISVSSVFSNTVQVKGPLSDPQIVPKTTGILWRGWAAFMKAGLSVVGESVVKRALASEDPCLAIKKQIRKDICGTQQPVAASPLVCPRKSEKLP